MGLRTLIHAVLTAENGCGLRVPVLRSQAARFALSLFLLAFLPLCGDLFAVRAGFVVEVVPIDDVDDAKEELSRGTAVVRPEGSLAQSSQTATGLAKSYEAWLAMLRNGQSNTGRPSQPEPVPRGPQAPSENQGCQGSGGGAAAAGSAVQPAGLPAVAVIVGPDLAMRLFARQADVHIEEIVGRLFRPPRQV